jgi:hypothetical protein
VPELQRCFSGLLLFAELLKIRDKPALRKSLLQRVAKETFLNKSSKIMLCGKSCPWEKSRAKAHTDGHYLK